MFINNICILASDSLAYLYRGDMSNLGLVVLAIAVQGFVYGFSLINFAVTLTLLVISAPITHQKLIICLK